MSTERSSSVVVLTVSFLSSVLVGFFAVVGIGYLVVRSGIGTKSSVAGQGAAQPFPNSVVVNGPGVVVRVPDRVDLNPEPGKDFLLYTWFKLRKPLEPNQRLVFVAKYDPASKIRPGYSLGLVNAPEGVRPILYWQNEKGDGRWYTFSSADLKQREWYMLGVTFRASRYLGVHLAEGADGKRISVLGGYDLGEDFEPPTNQAELEIGSFSGGLFKGRLGPFGIVGGRYEDADKVIKSVARSPLAIPSLPSGAEVVLWSDGRVDQGPRKVEILAPPAKAQAREED